MTASDVATESAPLVALRVVAAIGTVLAIVLIVIAFTRGVLMGLVALAVAPALPLTMVVVTDRLARH